MTYFVSTRLSARLDDQTSSKLTLYTEFLLCSFFRPCSGSIRVCLGPHHFWTISIEIMHIAQSQSKCIHNLHKT